MAGHSYTLYFRVTGPRGAGRAQCSAPRWFGEVFARVAERAARRPGRGAVSHNPRLFYDSFSTHSPGETLSALSLALSLSERDLSQLLSLYLAAGITATA